MSSLLSTMFLATGAMAADQRAFEATANNAADVNTPGYSRQMPILLENAPVVAVNLTFGAGISLQLEVIQKLRSLGRPKDAPPVSEIFREPTPAPPSSSPD